MTLSSSSLVDLPEGEGSQWRHFTSTRWATSASHLYDKPVTSSETWTWLHSPVFRATPLDMKAEADLHFLQGVNQLIGHGWPYSPPEAGEPGWRFYAAAVFNNHNPWWLVMPDIAAYLQRVSFLLRQGKPANDVAVYLPTADAYAGFSLGRDSVNQAMEGLLGSTLVPQILDAGYGFDFIDDGAIAHGGVPHPILILPGVERIPLATLEKIVEYARKGGTVIATRRTPSLAPGLMEAETDTPKIRELARGLRLLADETQARRGTPQSAGRRRGHRARNRLHPSQAGVRRCLLSGQHEQSPGARDGGLSQCRGRSGVVGSHERRVHQGRGFARGSPPGALRIARAGILERPPGGTARPARARRRRRSISTRAGR